MAVDEADIVNAALRLIGGDPITSLTDGSKNANVAGDMYTLNRDALLRAHTWRFATRLVTLSRLSTAPAFGHDFAYALPHDWLRTIAVSDNDNGIPWIAYQEAEVAGVGVIMASAENIFLEYIYVVTDTNRMSAGFHAALIAAMARDMALPTGSSNTMQETYAKKAELELRRARSADSLGSPSKQRPIGSWVASRHGRWGDRGQWPR